MTRRQFYVALAVLCVSGLVGGFVSGLVMPGRAAWAQDVTKEVRAERFVLVNGAGAELGSLGMLLGQGGLLLRDADGRTRLTMMLSNGDPVLWLSDSDGETRAMIGLQGGDPYLAFRDAEKREWASLKREGAFSTPTIALSAARGASARLGFDAGAPDLLLSGPTDGAHASARLGFDNLREPYLSFYGAGRFSVSDSMGRNRLDLGFTPYGSSSRLRLYDATGEVRTLMAVAGNVPILAHYDETGRVQWQAP